MLTATLTELAALAPDAAVLLVGRGSAEFAGRLVSARPELAGRVAASGGLSGADAAAHLKACDLLIQPFPDGVSSRRTSAMAGLACGLPVVTNLGPLSEPVWAGAVAAAPTPDPAAVARRAAGLLADPPGRAALAARAAALYRDSFALAHTVAALREGRP